MNTLLITLAPIISRARLEITEVFRSGPKVPRLKNEQ